MRRVFSAIRLNRNIGARFVLRLSSDTDNSDCLLPCRYLLLRLLGESDAMPVCGWSLAYFRHSLRRIVGGKIELYRECEPKRYLRSSMRRIRLFLPGQARSGNRRLPAAVLAYRQTQEIFWHRLFLTSKNSSNTSLHRDSVRSAIVCNLRPMYSISAAPGTGMVLTSVEFTCVEPLRMR